MTERQAAMTSYKEFISRLTAYREIQQAEWERARWMAFSIFSPFINKNRPKSAQRWFPFPWENKTDTARVVIIDKTKEDLLNNLYKDFMSRKNRKP